MMSSSNMRRKVKNNNNTLDNSQLHLPRMPLDKVNLINNYLPVTSNNNSR